MVNKTTWIIKTTWIVSIFNKFIYNRVHYYCLTIFNIGNIIKNRYLNINNYQEHYELHIKVQASYLNMYYIIFICHTFNIITRLLFHLDVLTLARHKQGEFQGAFT